MGRYRLDSIARLARQIRFTPLPRRLEQLASSEALLLQIRPDQTYTIDQITLALTGYEPRHSDPTLLIGVALQHDLGLFVEQLSESLQLHVNSSGVPILTIEEVAQRLSVTSKTVQRWRRRGLPAGRYTFADGKRRIGFRQTSVEQFVRSDGREIQSPVQTPSRQRTLGWLIEQAQRLAKLGYWEQLVGRRLARPAGLSPLAVTQLLREHAAHIRFVAPPCVEACRRVLEMSDDRTPLTQIAARMRMPLYGIYCIVLDRRFHRAMRKPIRFIDDPLYHQEEVLAAVDGIINQQAVELSATAEVSRLPRDLPPYLRELYRIPLLKPSQERGLFLKYHYLRYLAAQEQKSLDPQLALFRQLHKLDQRVRAARVVRAKLVEANLRLVVSVARKHVRPGVTLMELVSEGNMILMRAVDSFDVHRGYRFSTYAVYALMKGYARCIPAMLSQQSHPADSERLAEVFDPAADRATTEAELRDHVRLLMSQLEHRERDILAGRYGLSESRIPQTFQQIGDRLNLTRQRIIQIEQHAISKLRQTAKSV